MSADAATAAKPALNPAAIAVEDAARLLGAAAGQHVSAEMIRADIDAGAPVNGDGTLNLLHYTAWIIKLANDPKKKSKGGLNEIAKGGSIEVA